VNPCLPTGAGSSTTNAGFGLNMWATIVNRDGIVCRVVYTGPTNKDEWLGSRIISAQKANTANDFSLDHLALSTANLYGLVQPGGSLFGLQHSNPPDPSVAYSGDSSANGAPCTGNDAHDGMCGKKIGGLITFGGGLALYDAYGNMIGGLGVSGDSACADHFIAWRVRHGLCLDNTPNSDNIVFSANPTNKFEHGYCTASGAAETAVLADITANAPPNECH